MPQASATVPARIFRPAPDPCRCRWPGKSSHRPNEPERANRAAPARSLATCMPGGFARTNPRHRLRNEPERGDDPGPGALWLLIRSSTRHRHAGGFARANPRGRLRNEPERGDDPGPGALWLLIRPSTCHRHADGFARTNPRHRLRNEPEHGDDAGPSPLQLLIRPRPRHGHARRICTNEPERRDVAGPGLLRSKLTTGMSGGFTRTNPRHRLRDEPEPGDTGQMMLPRPARDPVPCRRARFARTNLRMAGTGARPCSPGRCRPRSAPLLIRDFHERTRAVPRGPAARPAPCEKGAGRCPDRLPSS